MDRRRGTVARLHQGTAHHSRRPAMASSSSSERLPASGAQADSVGWATTLWGLAQLAATRILHRPGLAQHVTDSAVLCVAPGTRILQPAPAVCVQCGMSSLVVLAPECCRHDCTYRDAATGSEAVTFYRHRRRLSKTDDIITQEDLPLVQAVTCSQACILLRLPNVQPTTTGSTVALDVHLHNHEVPQVVQRHRM